MRKKKRTFHPFRWGIGLIGFFLIGFWGGQRLQQKIYQVIPVGYDLPVWTKNISVKPNQYGDYLVGFLAGQNQDYERMVESWDRALKTDPHNEKLKTAVYLLKVVRGELQEALPLAIELSQLKKPELMTEYLLVVRNMQQKKYQNALQILEHKPFYGPDQILKPALQMWLYAGQNKKAEAEKALDRLKVTAQGIRLYYKALLAWYFGEADTADQAFQMISVSAGKGYPSLSSLILMRDFYREQGKWRAGFPPYDRMQAFLDKNPSLHQIIRDIPKGPKLTPESGSAIAFYDVSVALGPLKIEENSLILNAFALALAPDACIPRIWSGELLEQSGNYQAANKVYDRIPHANDVIYLKKVMNLIQLEDYASAHQLLKSMLSRNQDDGYLHLLNGQVLLQMKQMDEAVVAYQTAIDMFKKRNLNHEAGQALLSLGATYDKMEKEKLAEQSLLESIELNPNEAEALNYLGYLWLDKGKNIDQAFALVKKAAELAPEDPNIMDSLAWGYYLKKEYQAALPLAEKSTDLLPYSSIAYAHLGDIYAALGRKREAHYQYKKALDLTMDITPKLKEELNRKLGLAR